jgi:uncharacterized repeat protein (TIGR01451 family)
MSTTLKKSLLIGIGIFILIVVTIGVVYLVRKPTSVSTLPTPTPISKPTETAVPAPIFAVDAAVCKKSFVVACVSPSPSSSVSPSPSSYVSPYPSPSSTVSPSPSPVLSAALDCVSKKMYFDDTRNRSAFYYLENEITDTTTLTNGQTIVYNIVTRNSGGNSTPDTTVTDSLSSYLTYVDGDSGCTYDSTTRVVTCAIGTLSPNSEAQRSFRVKVAVVGTTSVANTAEVTSTNGQRDSCSVQINAAGQVITTVVTAQPTSLPVAGVFEVTAGTLGIGMLLLVLGGLGLLLI